MKSTKIISVTTIAVLLTGSLIAAVPAEARPWGQGGVRIMRPGFGGAGCGWGGCRRHWHQGWGWGGALAGAAIVGAIATAAAANQGNCQLAIYDGAGNFVGYRQGNC